jgi:ProP effector
MARAQTPTAQAPARSHPAIADMSPAACATALAERFPLLFATQPPLPIKLRVQSDIQQRAPGLFSKKTLSIFLHRYTTTTPYIRSLLAAPHRFDLDGQAAGDILEEHRAAATTELERRREIVAARRVAEREAAIAAGHAPGHAPGRSGGRDGGPGEGRGPGSAGPRAGGRPERGPRPQGGMQGGIQGGIQAGVAATPGAEGTAPAGRGAPRFERNNERNTDRGARPAGPPREARPPREGRNDSRTDNRNDTRNAPRTDRGPRPDQAPRHDGGRPPVQTSSPHSAASYTPEDPARRDRQALLRAFEGSSLSKANFLVLKRMTETDFDAQLAQARQERESGREGARESGRDTPPRQR